MRLYQGFSPILLVLISSIFALNISFINCVKQSQDLDDLDRLDMRARRTDDLSELFQENDQNLDRLLRDLDDFGSSLTGKTPKRETVNTIKQSKSNNNNLWTDDKHFRIKVGNVKVKKMKPMTSKTTNDILWKQLAKFMATDKIKLNIEAKAF